MLALAAIVRHSPVRRVVHHPQCRSELAFDVGPQRVAVSISTRPSGRTDLISGLGGSWSSCANAFLAVLVNEHVP